MNKNIHINDLTKKEIKIKKNLKNLDSFLMSYHITPPFGLLNDPNGVIQKHGYYYIHYQWYPGGPTHGLKHWSLLKTKDFINFKDLGVSNIPNSKWDIDGAFSGSYFKLNKKGYVVYTGNVNENGKIIQRQIIGKLDKNQKIKKKINIIEDDTYYSHEFRDPIVTQNGGKNYIITAMKRKDNMSGFSNYLLKNNLLVKKKPDIFTKYSKSISMIECPNIFNIKKKNFLLYSVQGFENDDKYTLQNKFNVICQTYSNIDFENGKIYDESNFFEIDKGQDFYAPQVFKNEENKYILIAWLGDGKSKYHDKKFGWSNGLTLPRELKVKNGYLIQKPLKELQKLRKSKSKFKNDKIILESKSFELNLKIKHNLEIKIGNSEKFILIKFTNNEIIFDRSNVDYQIESLHSNIRYVKRIDEIDNVKIFVDNSSIEMFVNNFKTTITSRFFIKNLSEVNFNQIIKSKIYYLKNIKIK